MAQEEIPALGHTFAEWTVTREASFLAEGEESRSCSRCGQAERRVLARLVGDTVVTDSSSGVSLEYIDDAYAGELTLQVSEQFDGQSYQILNMEKRDFHFVLYDIQTLVNGQVVQPNGTVLIRIPLPTGYSAEHSVVYYVANDGSGIQKLSSVVENGCICFETDHFSAYAVVDESAPIDYSLGDVDGDGIVSSSDARLALRAAVKLESFAKPETLAADADKDNSVTTSDARKILRVAVKLDTF